MTRTKERQTHEEASTVTVYMMNSTHHTTLLEGLNSLRERGELFDISFIVEGQVFRAHKVVLSACSDYFRAMFTDNMLEARQEEVCLNGISACGFKQLLEYAYTAKLALNLENVQEVLEAASHVQFLNVINVCSNYMQNRISLDNCVDIATIGETYSLGRLTMSAYKFMSGRMLEFSKTDGFYRLTPQQLQNLLAYDFPVDCSEADVLKIVLMWFLHFENSDIIRNAYPAKIVRYIHFKEITRRKLESIIDTVFCNYEKNDMNYRKLYKIIMSEMYLQTNSNNMPILPVLLNSRGMELAILKVGGFGMNGVTNEITYCFSNDRTWRYLTTIPHVEQCNFGTAVYNNELYVIGGCFNQSLQENIHPFGFKYSPRSNKWTTIAPMKIERCRFTLNVVGSMLYAVGGDTEGDESNSWECYDTTSDTWYMKSSFPANLIQHAGATYEDKYILKLFISGGVDRGVLQCFMHCYDVNNEKWGLCAPMLKARADHVMFSLGKLLFVCGGWTEDQDVWSRRLVDTIDVYNIDEDQWYVLTTVPTPRYHVGIVCANRKIYFIGGFQSHDMFDKGTAAIECYDIDKDVWITEEKYPQDVWEHTCTTLYLPKCRDDMEIVIENATN